MPTNIIDILIKAAGEWLTSSIDILLHATPMFGVPPMMLMLGFLIILVGGWNLMAER